TLPPLENCFVSGSRPRTPITVTLFKFAIVLNLSNFLRMSISYRQHGQHGQHACYQSVSGCCLFFFTWATWATFEGNLNLLPLLPFAFLYGPHAQSLYS